MTTEELRRSFLEAGISLDEKQARQFVIYSELLLECNAKFNLTAITDEAEIIHKHFIDSLSAAEFLSGARRVIDIGSGAGLPAIPLKIMDPRTEYVLLDSSKKRVGFLNDTIYKLGLGGAAALHARAEYAAHMACHREKYDCVLARALAPMNTLAEYALPFLKVGGRLIAYKGDKAREELALAENALRKLNGKVETVKEYLLMDTYQRRIAVIRKTAPNERIYPRTQNKPKKSPL